ncbi:MAG: hypothetical protein JJE21_01385 [Spirochaetaceae bacterium]|nr:hypothetical protein [Spirochaetaceae bacterium]
MFKNKMSKVNNNEKNSSMNNQNTIIRVGLSFYLLLLIALCCSILFQSCDLESIHIPSEDEIIGNLDLGDDITKTPDQNNENPEINTDEFDNQVFLKMDTSKIESTIDYIAESFKLKHSEWTMIDVDNNFTRDSSILNIYEQDEVISSMSFSYNGSEEYIRVNASPSQILVLDSYYKDFNIKVENDILYLYNDSGSFRFKEI